MNIGAAEITNPHFDNDIEVNRRLVDTNDRHFRVIGSTLARKWKIMASLLGGTGNEYNFVALDIIC